MSTHYIKSEMDVLKEKEAFNAARAAAEAYVRQHPDRDAHVKPIVEWAVLAVGLLFLAGAMVGLWYWIFG